MTGDRSIHSPIQIAVSGALGFIGRQVVARLVEKGAQIWAVDRLPKPKHFPDGVDFRCVDLAAEPDATYKARAIIDSAILFIDFSFCIQRPGSPSVDPQRVNRKCAADC